MPLSVALVTARDVPAEKKPDDRLLAEAFTADGWQATELAWDAPQVDWSDFSLVVLRSTWDYHLRLNEFRDWLEAREADGSQLCNSTQLVKWNLHKSYLVELSRNEVNTVPTRVVLRNEHVDPNLPFSHNGAVVAKPAVSATAWQTRCLDWPPHESNLAWLNAALADRDMLLQPKLEEIQTFGELSFMFFAGEFSHAVHKRARAGEFRVQADFGGSESPYPASDREVAEAAAMLAALPSTPVYARVDAAPVDGRLMLMEMELIEPQLFLGMNKNACTKLVQALKAQLT